MEWGGELAGFEKDELTIIAAIHLILLWAGPARSSFPSCCLQARGALLEEPGPTHEATQPIRASQRGPPYTQAPYTQAAAQSP